MSAQPSVSAINTALLTSPVVPARQYTVAVAGNPNAGKTSLFNTLTGLRQKVANYPGVTVESKSGVWLLDEDSSALVVDLPGLYSLNATSIDEQIARDVLIDLENPRHVKFPRPDVIILVVDSTNLSRNLYLATQVVELGAPVVVALTMFDLAQRNGTEIDIEQLSRELGVPVVPVIARKRVGIDTLAKTVLSVARAGRQVESNNDDIAVATTPAEVREHLVNRYRQIEEIVRKTVHRRSSARVDLTGRIDSLVTHKVFGPIILLVVMVLVFQTIFSWANLPMTLIENVFTELSHLVRATLPAGIFTDLLADGVIAGVGGVLVFLPQILLLFFFISLLEDSGYMARAAFLMDRLMRSVGLDGKAFLPLLSSFACAVPGIMATRTIENPKDRFATMMVAPFMSCSARLPVYTLMIAACFSRQKVFGFLSLGVIIILAMYLLGIVVAVGVAWLLKRTILSGPTPPFVMELPVYRVPNFTNVAHTMFTSAGLFVKRAGTVILAISILLWALTTFPRSDASGSLKPSQQVSSSFAGRAGRLIEPLIKPLGFDWKIGIGLISSFAARETIVSTLSVVYNVGDEANGESKSLVETMSKAKRADGTPVWTPLVAVSLMVFFVLACQCMSTLAIVRRETNSWRWPLFMVSYMLVLAYVASLLTFQGGKLLGFS